MREFTFNTRILGPGVRVVVIFRDKDSGVWIGHERLQKLLGDAADKYFGHVSEGDYNHAKAGYTVPLMQALGVGPEVALRRLPAELAVCHFSGGCPREGPDCWFGSGSVPECFMASGPSVEVRTQLHQMVWAMIEGAWVVIVTRGQDVV